jgi:mannosyltransferase OCH1-like enzyme
MYSPKREISEIPQSIPRKIVSILILDDRVIPPLPTYIHECLDSWYNLCPEYEIQILDKNMCLHFLTSYFPIDIIEAYNSLKPYAYKCDFIRICWLYIFGGIYKDIRQTLLTPLSKIINNKNNLIIVKDLIPNPKYTDHPIINAFIACTPRHPMMKMYIDNMVENIKNKYYGKYSLDITGPNLFGKIARNFIGGKGKWKQGDYNTYQILNFDGKFIYKDGFKIIKSKPKNPEFTSDFANGNSYSQMWKNKTVYT